MAIRFFAPLLAALLFAACGRPGHGGPPASTADAGLAFSACGASDAGDSAVATAAPYLSPTRQLRRIKLSLTGQAPVASDYQALLDAGDSSAQQALLDQAVDDALANPTFYTVMEDFGREWIRLPPIPRYADAPDYMASQQHNLPQCPPGTALAGMYASYSSYLPGNPPCTGYEPDGGVAPRKTFEPWWAPGTTVTVVGSASNDSPTATVNGKTYDCGADWTPDATVQFGSAFISTDDSAPCGCGPNLLYCHPGPNPGWANWPMYVIGNPYGQRRLLWEEPARLVAHVAWYDRPLTDLILGTYSVGPVEVQAAYVREGRRTGAVSLDQDQSWWRPQSFTGPVDPFHQADDPLAWREFSVPARNPYLLPDRTYTFDPRTQPVGSMRGIPAAGVLTMIGMLGAYPRERVRAARMLESFACEEFVPPPAGAVFNPYVRDPAAEGPCQTCHSRIDPAAIHFKRLSMVHSNIDNDGAYLMVGVGNWHFPDRWAQLGYPFQVDPFPRWVQWFQPRMRMTPISDADLATSEEARFIDFLPPDQTLLGQVSDGTVGPLGFAKMVVASGAFDVCAVQRLHERFVGRRLDPATESGYLQSLVSQFVSGGRKVRPFLKHLTQTDVFRRGL